MSKPRVRWRGSFAVIVTPFKKNGALDEAAYRKVVDYVIKAGCHGVIAAGSTGEFFLMSDDERGQVVGELQQKCQLVLAPNFGEVGHHLGKRRG